MPHYRKNMEGTRYFATDDHPGFEALGSWHLEDDHGKIRDMAVKIERVASAKVGIGKQGARKNVALVLTRSGSRWALVMGATMCKTVEKITGSPDTDKWHGQLITLYRTTTTGKGGEEVFCIRIRPTPPTAKTAASAPEPTADPAPEPNPEDDGRETLAGAP